MIECTDRDIDGYFSRRSWDKGKALILTVGDVITDVKLVCFVGNQYIISVIHHVKSNMLLGGTAHNTYLCIYYIAHNK